MAAENEIKRYKVTKNNMIQTTKYILKFSKNCKKSYPSKTLAQKV